MISLYFLHKIKVKNGIAIAEGLQCKRTTTTDKHMAAEKCDSPVSRDMSQFFFGSIPKEIFVCVEARQEKNCLCKQNSNNESLQT